MKVRIKFVEPVLGTLSGNKDAATDFILSKNPAKVPAQDEIEALPEDEALEKSSTIFPREDGRPFIWDYQLKGFFKDSCLALIMSGKMTQEELKKIGLTKYLYKRTIDMMLFVRPRKMFLTIPEGGKIEFCERPLRGQTMRGERISLARSEMLPAGTTFEAEIMLLDKKLEDFLKPWLDYGALRGLLQWRNSGMGSFVYEVL
ncbi:MAG: hypothetical protein PHG53_09650 [Phycisphaerae bacterium]|nr:hypothetical protein [Phycisphaerae bacterium]